MSHNPSLLEFARRFHARSLWHDIPMDAAAVGTLLTNVQTSADGFFEISPAGMIAAMIVPLPFNPSVKVAAELIWYSESPGEGRRLRESLENWAKSKGATFVQFSAMADAHEQAVRRLLERGGYRPVEIGFRKAL